MTSEEEIEAVRRLGDKIGYGNLMDTASKLWYQTMKDDGFPTDGVFIPVCPYMVKIEYLNMMKKEYSWIADVFE